MVIRDEKFFRGYDRSWDKSVDEQVSHQSRTLSNYRLLRG